MEELQQQPTAMRLREIKSRLHRVKALAGMEVFWTIYGEDAQIIDSTFTMPAKALEIMVNVSNEPDDDENDDPTGFDFDLRRY